MFLSGSSAICRYLFEWDASGAADVGGLLELASIGEGDCEGEDDSAGVSVWPAGGESSRERLAMPSVV